MLLLPRGIATELECYPPRRPDANPTVDIIDRGGTAIVTAAVATRDSVATTLAQNSGKGARQIELASVASVAEGRKYRVAAGALHEFVEVVRISGVHVYLAHETSLDHDSGAAFEGTRLSYSATPATDRLPQIGWRAVFAYQVGSVAQAPIPIDFAVVRHAVQLDVTLSDVLDVFPTLPAYVSEQTNWRVTLRRAFDRVTELLCLEGVDPGAVVGLTRFREAICYQALLFCFQQGGEIAIEDRKLWAEELRTAMDLLKATSALDKDGDGSADEHEQEGAGGGLWLRG